MNRTDIHSGDESKEEFGREIHGNKGLSQPIFSRQITTHLPDGSSNVVRESDIDLNITTTLDTTTKSSQASRSSTESHPGSHLISQSDSSGRQKRVSQPTYDHSDSSPLTQVFSFRRFFCCLKDSRRDNFSRSRNSSRQFTNSNTLIKTIVAETKQCILPPQTPENKGKKCLVLDLDETLVHSSFQVVQNSDYVIPVLIENTVNNVYVLKRPGVDEFMKRMGQYYEIIIYTASLSKYADPLLDKLDIHNVIQKRLFRESCVFHDGHYVKDLSLLRRELCNTIIVDNSPMSYAFHPDNAIGCGSYIDDNKDIEMWQIADFLESIRHVDDVRDHCRMWREWCYKHPSTIPVNRK